MKYLYTRKQKTCEKRTFSKEITNKSHNILNFLQDYMGF